MSHIRGRQPIGINQPPGGGSLYPFVNPSDDIKYLLGDFFIAFDDLEDEVVYPLRIKWLYGFGSNSVSPISGYPTPIHAQDIIVVDANDFVVFNSTTATTFKTEDWDSRLTVVEWATETIVCRCTFHYEWTAADIADGETVTYDTYIEPTSSELQIDTWYKMPKRVTSFVVGLNSIAKNNVVFKEGYNIGLNANTGIPTLTADLPVFVQSKILTSGTRLANQVRIDATPGSGLGIYSSCDNVTPLVKKINGVVADGHQNIFIDSEACIRNQRPVGVVNYATRQVAYSDFYVSPTQAASAVKLSNDCTCCCACDYFARTYQGLKRQWFLFRDIAQSAETARDNYANNIDRWLIQKQIRETDNIRLRVSVDGNCKVRYGAALCNSSKCCLFNVQFYFTFVQYVNGVLQVPSKSTFNCPPTLIDGPASCAGKEKGLPTILDEHGQMLLFTVDYADPQEVITISGKHCFPDCKDLAEEGLKTFVHVAISWSGTSVNPNSGVDCNYADVSFDSFPDDVKTIWSNAGYSTGVFYSQKSSNLYSVDKTNPYCYQCECS